MKQGDLFGGPAPEVPAEPKPAAALPKPVGIERTPEAPKSKPVAPAPAQAERRPEGPKSKPAELAPVQAERRPEVLEPQEPAWVRSAPPDEPPSLERPDPIEPPWARASPIEEHARPAPAPPAAEPEPVPAWRRAPAKRQEPKVLSVAELTRSIKETIEPAFFRVLVRGEITGYRGPNVRGHLYFALKDDAASIDVKVWQSTAQRLRFAIKDGLEVIIEGSIDLYEASGRYSLIVQRIEPSGVGALALAFEQLKAKLLAEGLFGPARKKPKRPLPALPRRIGVVTSVTGAALRDFLKVLHRRHPNLSVLVADTRVQGADAAPEIAHAIRRMGKQAVDVVVVTRGGGSIEDLWAFNEESVARAIFACPIPVVSAIGHEVDVTLADFVADHRAPTPSAAAEAIAPVLADLQLHLANQRARLRKAVERQLIDKHRELGHLEANLPDPRRELSQRKLQLSELAEEMRAALERQTRGQRDELRALNAQLQRLRPQAQLQATRRALQQLAARLQSAAHLTFRRQRNDLAGWRERLQHASPKPAAHSARGNLKTVRGRLPMLVRSAIAREKVALQSLNRRLNALDPEQVLKRGYAIALTPGGHAVRSADEVKPGEQLKIRLGSGELDVGVTATRPKK